MASLLSPSQIHVTLYVRVWIETSDIQHNQKYGQVTLYVRVWIETGRSPVRLAEIGVTLYVRVWIETIACLYCASISMSPST